MDSKCGDIVHVKEFVKELISRGSQVILQIRGKMNGADLTTINLPNLDFPLSAWAYFTTIFTTLTYLLIKKPVFVYQRDSGINIGMLVAKILRFPIVLEINGDFSLDAATSSRVLRLLQNIFMNITYSIADIIIIPSRNQIFNVRKHKAKLENVLVVPNGVDPRAFRPLNKVECKNQLGLDQRYYHLCFVGNLAPWQGLDIALLAFSRFLTSTRIPIRFLIAGDGKMARKLRQQVVNLSLKDNVIFLGSVPHDLIPYVINACDVCLAPFTSWRNKEIGVSAIKLFEYLSCGKPVITTAVPGATKLVKELRAGIVVKPDDVEGLENAYEDALERLPEWEEKGEIWHSEMALNHSWENRVNQILERIQYAAQSPF